MQISLTRAHISKYEHKQNRERSPSVDSVELSTKHLCPAWEINCYRPTGLLKGGTSSITGTRAPDTGVISVEECSTYWSKAMTQH